MFIHHLIIAFRNLWKYKTQNIISIIGLAVGFACFAFSALWIRYEMSYDSFRPKADRIYRVYAKPFKWEIESVSEEIQNMTSYQLSGWLKSNIPEIEEACAIRITFPETRAELTPFPIMIYDQNFCKMFGDNLPETLPVSGQMRPLAVTPELNNEETIKLIKDYLNYEVQTILPRSPVNTNIKYSMAVSLAVRNLSAGVLNSWNQMFETYILVREGVDIKALEKKFDKIDIPEWKKTPMSLVLVPLKQLRYKDPSGRFLSEVKFGHIQFFAIAGLLVILCSLFNHLTLYVTHVRMRMRELALRKVSGATDWQIAATLYTDFILLILLSLVAGFILMSSLLSIFKEYASIGNANVGIYTELLVYAALLIVFGFIACGIPILFFRKQVLNESIRESGSRGSRNLFQKSVLLVQLIISLGMIFCATIVIKQVRFLYRDGLGINRHNIGSFEPSFPVRGFPLEYVDRVKQIPGVIDAMPVRGGAFLRNMAVTGLVSTMGSNMTVMIEKDGQQTGYTYFVTFADNRFFDFFGVEIIEGMKYPNDTANAGSRLVVNEKMMNDLRKDNVSSQLNIVGVARNFYLSPTAEAKPIAILHPNYYLFTTIAIKYEEGFREQIEKATDKMLRDDTPDHRDRDIFRHYMDDIFEEQMVSEQALLKLVTIMTIACILIAIFGVYSLANLTCEKRRKEIAIRKINGAEVVDIMNIFFKEYLLMLGLAALVAFPAGYLIMKNWLESYVKQTSMDAWIYILIFLIVFVVIVFSIVSMVWKAANQNPAEAIKTE